MQLMEKRTQQADSLLAPYAVKHATGLDRMEKEEEDATRLRFQRDRGRIVHTQEFRRLKGKTQVFVGGGGDHFRTRLTHTMEVSGISRDIARTLQLNEDLAECIALTHDLGHPPFGHAGEDALNTWMQTQGSHFEHNRQSYRIVTKLAEHSSLFEGLNLNREILEGLLKHATPHDYPSSKNEPRRLHAPSLEAQVVNIADEIAYAAHDCEDGLHAGLFHQREIMKLPLVAQAYEQSETRGTSLRGSLINLLVTDLYEATEAQFVSHRITTLDNVYGAKEPLVCFSKTMQQALEQVHTFLWNHMYNHKEVLRRSNAGKKLLHALCEEYFARPPEKVIALQKRTGDTLAEAVKDYVAGMTDSYAFLQANEEGVMTEEMSKTLGE